MTTSAIPNAPTARYDAAIQFLAERIDYERTVAPSYHARQYNLERMRELLDRLDNPQRGFRILHIAGTKGKGSTAAMIAAILSAAGYRTGRFTSPHLDVVEERVAVDGSPCSPEELVDALDRVRPAVEAMDRSIGGCCPENGPTYFDITTAVALVHFARRNVDAAVLEVGLGGRLDSTNVCRPELSLITSISFDHVQQLGNTLAAIAREKAGIVKPGVPVVSGVIEAEPREVIRQTCRQQQSRLLELGVDFDFDYRPPRGLEVSNEAARIDFHSRTPEGQYTLRDLALGLLGRHQGANAAVALAAVGQLQQSGWEIPERAVRSGLAGLTWPARVELVARRPTVLLDAAHNPASAEALVRTINESFSARRRFLVFAATREKDVRGMLGCLLRQFDEVVLTQYLNNPRALPAKEAAAAARELTGRSYRVCAGPAEAWSEVRGRAGPDDLVCVTGSFFIAAQIRREIRARPFPPPSRSREES